MKIKRILSVVAVLAAPRVVVALVSVTLVLAPQVAKKAAKSRIDSASETPVQPSLAITAQWPATSTPSTITLASRSSQTSSTSTLSSAANVGSYSAQSSLAANTVPRNGSPIATLPPPPLTNVNSNGVATVGGTEGPPKGPPPHPKLAYSWNSATSSNYNNANQWTPNGVPLNPGDSGTVPDQPGTTPYTITLDVSPNIDSFDIQDPNATFNLNGFTMTVSGAFLNSGTVTNSGTVSATAGITNNAGGQFVLNDNQTMTLTTGTITNNGTIMLNSSGNATNLRLGTNTTLNGSGTITMGNSGANQIFVLNAGDRLTNNSTIQGSGNIGIGFTKITNNGLIVANQTAPLVIDPTDAAGDAINTGTLRATNGATLVLGLGQYTNTGGTIEALNASTVDIHDGARIIGGTVTTAGTGVIGTSNSFELQGVTNGGLIRVDDNRSLRLFDGLTNNGTVMLNSTGNGTELRIGNDVSLSGMGTISSSNTQANRIYGVAGTERLTIGANQIVQGSMQFGLNFMRFTNNGVIDANLSGGISVDPTDASGDAINNGTMQASNGATMTLGAGTYTNNGTIRALDTSTVNIISNALIVGGTITTAGSGVVQSGNSAWLQDITNTGHLNVQDNTSMRLFGTITNNSTLTLSSTGNNTDLQLGSDTTIGGTGMISGSNTQANRIYAANGTDRLTVGANQVVQGAMQFGVNQMHFTNNGTIDANVSAGITVDPTDADGDAVNNGIMQASNGSTLTLNLGIYTNTTGTIRALANSFVNLSGGARISGGTLTTTDLTGMGGVIQSANDASLQNVTSTGFVNLPDNKTLRLLGTFTNNGMLKLNSSGNNSDLRIDSDVTVAGTGMISTSNFITNRIFATNGTDRLTISTGATIQGSFQLGVDSMRFTNNGLINANASSGVTIDPINNSGDAINNGTMQAAKGATLTLNFGTYTNTNGIIQALDASVVNLRDQALIDGGIVTTAGSGVVQTFNDASLQNVTNNGFFNIPDNTRLRLFGSFINNGTLMLNSTGNNTELRIGTDLTLSGTGVLASSNTQANRIFGLAGTERLTIAGGYTLHGSFQLGADAMRFTNNGIIDANTSAGITIDPTNATGDAINNGTLQASSGGTLTLAFGNYTNNGTIQALDTSTVNLRDQARIIGGIITTAGSGVVQTINDASLEGVTNNGLFNIPDNTTLRLFGSFTNDGTLMLSSAGNNTNLLIGSDLTLSGTGVLASSNTQANRIFGVAGTERLTIGSSYTFQGSFQLGLNFMRLTNNGTINANTTAGMAIDPTDAMGDAVNNGLIEATSGSTLTMALGLYDNTNGTIQALGGSFVNLRDNATIIGGTLTTKDLTGNGGVIQSINTATLQDLTNNGFVRLQDNTSMQLVGAIIDNGIIQINSGGNNTDLRISGGDVTLNGNGTITASNTLANRIYSNGTGNETLTNGASHTIEGTMQLGLNFMNFVNQGLLNSNQSNLIVDPTSTALNDTTGVFRASNGATLTLTGGTYTNNGTYEALNGSLIQMNGDAALTNYDSGTMTLTGGTYRAVSTGNQATLNLNIGQIVNNAATIILDGVMTSIHTSDNTTDALMNFVNNATAGVFTIQNGRNFDRTNPFTNAGLVNIGTADSTFTAVQFDLSGTLTGLGALTTSGPLNWTAGTMSAAGTTNTNGAFNISTNANKFLSARTINAAAKTNWLGSDIISIGDGAIFNNLVSGTFNAQANQSMTFSGSGANGTFNNLGLFNKTGAGTTTAIGAIFNNSGMVSINSGTLSLGAGGTDTGGFVDASGAALTFNGGTHALNNGSSVTGAGAVNFTAGIANFASGSSYGITGLTSINGGAVNFNNAATGAGTTFLSGILGGTGSYAASGGFTWSGGTMQDAGATNANGGLTLNGGVKTLIARTLNNNGAATWSAGNLSTGQGATFGNLNGATFDDSFDAMFLFNQGGTRTAFNNGGTFTKSGGTGTTLMEAGFANSGIVNGNSGTISFAGGGTNGGTFNIANGARIQIQLNNFVISGAVNGMGTLQLTSATTTFIGNTTNSAMFLVDGGTATFNGTTNVSSAFTLTSGTVNGSGTLTNKGGVIWSGGAMTGTGMSNFNAASTLNGGNKSFTQRTINNNGMATWSAGDITSGDGAAFNNLGAGFFDVNFDGNWLFSKGGTMTQFNNAGTFEKIAGSGTTLMQVAFNNTGTVRVNSGTLSFSQGIQGSSGTVNVSSGSTLDVSSGTTASSASVLSLNGNLNLGANNFTVSSSYTNANFGTGNTFNGRANISGTGMLLAAADVNQTLSGNVTNGGTTTPTMSFGNVHVGDPAVMLAYVINAAGTTGPSILGALQTAANGGNITDSRLSGSGVTAGNFGPISPGNSSGNLNVTFNPTTAGALVGQVLHITNNFDNVRDQNLTINGAVYRLAAASQHTPEPVNFGVVHIGDTASQTLSITNTAANDGFSERLDAAFGGTTGGATASGSFSLLAPGGTNNSSLHVGINTATAGNMNGTATINLTSNGTGTSGLGNTALPSQTVNINGQVNFYADPVLVFRSGQATLTRIDPTHYVLDFGKLSNMQGVVTAGFDVQNFLHNLNFQDLLNGTFNISGVMNFVLTGFEAFSGVGPGGNDPNQPTVSFDPNRPSGTYTDNVFLTPTSTNPSGTTGIPGVPQIQVTLQATVPEPRTWALLSVGGIWILIAAWRKGRKA